MADLQHDGFDMRLGMSTHLFAFGQLNESHLDLLGEAGFDRLEMWGMSPHVDWYDPAEVERISRHIRRSGLRVVSFHLPFYVNFGTNDFKWVSFRNPDPDVRKLADKMCRHTVDLCGGFGCDIVVLHGNGEEDPAMFDQSDALFRMGLNEFLPYCEKRGVRIAIENIVTEMSKTPVLKNLVDEYASDYLWICLDTGHANLNETVPDAIRECGERLLTTHIADNKGEEDEHLVPYKGNIDWDETLLLLKEHCPNLENFTFELMYPSLGNEAEIDVFREILAEAKAAWERMNRGR